MDAGIDFTRKAVHELSERYNNLDAMMERCKEELRRCYELRRPGEAASPAEEGRPETGMAAEAVQTERAAVQQAVQDDSYGTQPRPSIMMPSAAGSERHSPEYGDTDDTARNESEPEEREPMDDSGYIYRWMFTQGGRPFL